MSFRSRETRPQDARSRRRGLELKPRADGLESRQLMTAIDLNQTPTAPYGVLFSGLNSPNGAGFSSANIGDANGDGFDDFLVGAPVLALNTGGFPAPGQGNTSQTFLIFGSKRVGSTAVADWLALTANDRVADLGQLGNPIQNNPINGTSQFPFDGLTFQIPSVQNAQLGASVSSAGDLNGDGFADFLIGAPGAVDPNNPFNLSGGRAYLVYGGANLTARAQKVIDLGNAASFNDIPVVTFTNSQLGAQAGRSVAGLGDFLPDGIPDIAIGAPGATVNGIAASGAVAVIPGSALRPATTRTIDLRTVGQTGGTPGILFGGQAPGQGVGFSVAGPGDVDGRTPGTAAAADLLIGAPDTTTGLPGTAGGPGRVYLVYGGNSLLSQSIVTSGLASINVGRVGIPTAPTDIAGAVFVGAGTGDLTGYAVSSAGDFNGDSLADVFIGSPGFANFSGRASMIYGLPANSTGGALLGTYALSSLPTGVGFAEFDGGSAGDLAGYSVGATGFINNDNLNEILVGAPGVLGGSGAAYLIPGNADLNGVNSLNLAAVQGSPVLATVITNSQPVGANFLGTSVGGRTFQASGLTADADGVADFMIGAPGFSLNSARRNAGAGFALEGAFIPLATPVSTVITSAIGVDNKVRPPFVINPTTPADLSFYILSTSSNTPGFTPPRDIDPTTITVNGVALPDPSTFQNAGDVDGDGIDDAVFTFSPRSDLGIPLGNSTITIQARTLATSPIGGDRRYRGSATVTARTGPGPGPPPGPTQFNAFDGAFPNLNAAVPPYGERFLPTTSVLGRARWAPLPPALAYRQFVPQGAFGARYRNFFHPIPQLNQSKGKTIGGLTQEVFSRSRFPKGVYFGGIDHKGPTIGGGNTGVGPYGVNLHRLPNAQRTAQAQNLPAPRRIKTR